MKRILLGVLLTALTVVAVPVNQASADHASDPCNDPSAQPIGPVQVDSIDHPGYDVWTDPGGGLHPTDSYQWAVVADGPIKVSTYYSGPGGHCFESTSVECTETDAPFVCHRVSFSPNPEWIVVEHGKPGQGSPDEVDYALIYVGADPL